MYSSYGHIRVDYTGKEEHQYLSRLHSRSSSGDLIVTPLLSRVNSLTTSVYKEVRFIAVTPGLIKIITTRPTASPSRIRLVNAEASNHKYTGVLPATSWGIVYRKISRPSGRGY